MTHTHGSTKKCAQRTPNVYVSSIQKAVSVALTADPALASVSQRSACSSHLALCRFASPVLGAPRALKAFLQLLRIGFSVVPGKGKNPQRMRVVHSREVSHQRPPKKGCGQRVAQVWAGVQGERELMYTPCARWRCKRTAHIAVRVCPTACGCAGRHERATPSAGGSE